MPFFAKRLTAALLLAAYLAASVLSSAFHDHQHGSMCAGHCHVAGPSKTASHHCHHHHHGHGHAGHAHATEQGKPAETPRPLHDDHCQACRFLALATVLTPQIDLADGGEFVAQVSASRSIFVVSAIAGLRRSRAPPAQG